ncbi:MAG: alpha/beta fold hydrolase [Alphaproteobacteria bacterium]|nr:alpha/beta fold hydrolase [Alphaproteobacteria bacterium]
MRRWRGLKALVHDAVDATADLVREGNDASHRQVRRVTDRIDGIAGPARVIDGVVRLGTHTTVASVQAVNRVVEALTDVALDATVAVDPAPAEPPIPLRSDIVGSAAWIADAALAAVNGAVGDHLAARGNGLDLGMVLRLGDRYLDGGPVDVSGPVVVLVHGLATTEWCWALEAEAYHGDPAATFGSMLEADAGLTPIYARYNTGRAVAENGRTLAEQLEALVAGGAITRVVLVGHSMGGLVARSACDHAVRSGHRWLALVDLVVSLGTPHQGAPLARLGASATSGLLAIDVPTTQVLARVLAARSAGVRDLEHGDVPLLDGVRYAFLSATVTEDPEHPAGRWLGDLLVQVGSASGPRGVEERTFPIHTATFGGVMHHQLQCHPAVYRQLRELVVGE